MKDLCKSIDQSLQLQPHIEWETKVLQNEKGVPIAQKLLKCNFNVLTYFIALVVPNCTYLVPITHEALETI